MLKFISLILSVFAFTFFQTHASDFVWKENGKIINADVIAILENDVSVYRIENTAWLNHCKISGSCALISQKNTDGVELFHHINHQIFIRANAELQKNTVEKLENHLNLKCLNCNDFFDTKRNSGVLIFDANNLLSKSAIDAIRYLNKKDIIGIEGAYPNRLDVFTPDMLNDFYLQRSWFILNMGQRVFCYGNEYVEHAVNLGISDVWEQGITGENIRIGVMDFDGFEFTHPDMHGQFSDGWNGITNTAYTQHSFQPKNQAHGMAVSGIIAAKADNLQGSAGVAFDSRIVPLLIDGSEISVLRVLQKAGADGLNLDLINMSFSYYGYSNVIAQEIAYLSEHGREYNGENKGILFIASHGNDGQNDDVNKPFPAFLENVLAIGASTPDDFLKVKGDKWDNGSSWGSNYGKYLDLIAPGVCIFTTDFSGQNGYVGGQDYMGFERTSASAPIATGIAALVLQSDPSLSATELSQRLKSTADKTHLNIYQYSNGKSSKTGYGRINAFRAINRLTSNENDITESDINLITSFLTKNNLTIHTNKYQAGNRLLIELYELSGKRLIQYESIHTENILISHNLNLLRGSLYIVSIFNKSNNQFFTKKLIVL